MVTPRRPRAGRPTLLPPRNQANRRALVLPSPGGLLASKGRMAFPFSVVAARRGTPRRYRTAVPHFLGREEVGGSASAAMCPIRDRECMVAPKFRAAATKAGVDGSSA